jgi:hypothetical protein
MTWPRLSKEVFIAAISAVSFCTLLPLPPALLAVGVYKLSLHFSDPARSTSSKVDFFTIFTALLLLVLLVLLVLYTFSSIFILNWTIVWLREEVSLKAVFLLTLCLNALFSSWKASSLEATGYSDRPGTVTPFMVAPPLVVVGMV